MRLYGLVGHPLTHSFSRQLFLENFHGPDLDYQLFDHAELTDFISFLKSRNDLAGFNITIPHKVNILRHLDTVSSDAEQIGAVNTVLVTRSNGNTLHLEGHNTDLTGFDNSLSSIPLDRIDKVFILGTGGAAQAVKYALARRSISSKMVSRSAPADNPGVISYETLHIEFGNKDMLVNCTPSGMHGTNIPELISPDLFSNTNVVYDLIYNPEETVLLRNAGKSGAFTKNGMEMLRLQAKESWRIWGLIS